MKRISLILTLTVLSATAWGDDWRQFRGPGSRGVAANANPPAKWSPEDATWKTSLEGRAVSGLIVVGDHVIATSSSGLQQDRLHVWSLDAASGEVRWHRSFWATGRTLCHPLSAMAAPTPTTDGNRLYVLFASNDLVCLDLKGTPQWIRSFGRDLRFAFDDRGLASSPVVIGDRVVVQIECQGDSYAFGIDTRDGSTKWQIPLAKKTSWTTPVAIDVGRVLLQSTEHTFLLDPRSGSVLWKYETQSNMIPSPTVAKDRLLLPSGGLKAVRLSTTDEEADVLWEETRITPARASPVVDGDNLYVIRQPNILVCGSVETGKEKWRTRLKGREFWSSPILAGKHLYIPNSEGVVFVVDTTENGKIVSENNLGEEMLGSPAVSGDAIYFRGVEHVWKVGK